jgi:hypothetical protein
MCLYTANIREVSKQINKIITDSAKDVQYGIKHTVMITQSSTPVRAPTDNTRKTPQNEDYLHTHTFDCNDKEAFTRNVKIYMKSFYN